MRRFVIECPDAGNERFGSFDVIDEYGRCAGGLGFDEMLGQVVSLTHPRLEHRAQFRMQTPEQWQQHWDERAARHAALLHSTTTESTQ